MRRDLVVVTGEPVWPPVHGGRLRVARIVEELARALDVLVVAPVEAEPPSTVAVAPMPDQPGHARTAPGRPRLGRALLGPPRVRAVRAAIERAQPRAVLFTHSYLAAMVPDVGVPTVVDFQDVEWRRMARLTRIGSVRARAFFAWEAAKARRWEPAVARRAAVVAATCAADAGVLASWGANPVLVPHGMDRVDLGPSPARGPVTFVASFGYAPNRDAARFVIDEVWPRLRRTGVPLRIAGRRAGPTLGGTGGRDGIEVVSDPVSIDQCYAEASVVLAPVRTGGGAQLKVTEALARGRTLIASPYSAAAAPGATRPAIFVARDAPTFAGRVLDAWTDAPARWERERALAAVSVPSWAETCAPLLDALSR